MSVLIRAGILALGAVLLIPSGSARGESAPQEPLLLVVEAPDTKETITVLQDSGAQKEDFDTYLTQVVLSEMPADFAPEALKAQAVAARTFARRQMSGGKHADADVCSQSACCQACLSADALRERYGATFDAAWDKAADAVRQTQDEVLTYGDALIDAVYFSCSGGSTEAAAAVWGTDVPYLQAVDSPGEQDAAPYASTVTCSPAEFAETLGLAADGDPAGWLGGTSYTAGGGVDTCTIRGQAYAGTRLRQLFGLNSTRFALRYADGVFRFDVRGYGHRVGMSQYGANAIARLGFDYQTILRYYYRGARIETQRLPSQGSCQPKAD